MIDASRWEELHARTGDNLAAAREIFKDAGTVKRWARKVREDVQRERAVRQKERAVRLEEAGRSEWRQKGFKPASAPNQPIPGPVVVVRLESNLDFAHSPSVLSLLLLLALDLANPPLEDSSQESIPSILDKKSGPPPVGQSLNTAGQSLDPAGQSLVVDLREVKLIDRSGVSCLISCRRRLAGNGHRLVVLLAPGSQPEKVFARASLGRIITACGSLDDL